MVMLASGWRTQPRQSRRMEEGWLTSAAQPPGLLNLELQRGRQTVPRCHGAQDKASVQGAGMLLKITPFSFDS